MLDQPHNRDTLTNWDLFVLRHKDRRNIFVHFLSFLMYYFSPILSLFYRNPWYLLGLPLSGAIGALGHYLFKDGTVNKKEATHSAEVVFFVTIMFYKIFKGSYTNDIQIALDKLNNSQKTLH